ncbi:MAG TPA: isoprenylcysteine carboxylmethyltransferase family protein [Vicinamibacterales bacterium]
MVDVLARIARWRVPLGYVCGVVSLALASPTPRTLLVGACIGVVGEAIRIWAAGHLEKGREVTTSGPYAFMRHPLYLGSSIMGGGVALAARSAFVAVLVFFYLLVTITAAVRTEEAHLTMKFGGAYAAYREGEFPSAWRTFSIERAMRNREYRAALGFLAAIALLTLMARLR